MRVTQPAAHCERRGHSTMGGVDPDNLLTAAGGKDDDDDDDLLYQ